MTTRVEIAPAMLAWAAERSGKSRESLLKSFPMLSDWEAGTVQPTFNQLEEFARSTYTALGYFFLPDPPDIVLPIPDLRTVGSHGVVSPSSNLLDTIATCLDRQDWFRSYLIDQGEEPLSFVGSLSTQVPVLRAAEVIRKSLDFAEDARVVMGSWEEALRILVANAETLGILVMISGIVGSDTHRKLDPTEFRGFALADSYAPVVFINGADAKSAQIFTLVHEIVHIWLGTSALTNGGTDRARSDQAAPLERWVNLVAAELLVPEASITRAYKPGADLVEESRRLSRLYKVSPAVTLRRLFEIKLISWEQYRGADEETETLAHNAKPSGGNFYNTAPLRASRRFTRAVVASTLEGRTLYRDAFRLLGFRSQKAFDGLSHELGLA